MTEVQDPRLCQLLRQQPLPGREYPKLFGKGIRHRCVCDISVGIQEAMGSVKLLDDIICRIKV